MKKHLADILCRLTRNDETLSELIFEADEEIGLDFLQALGLSLARNTHIASLVFLNNFLSEEHVRLIGNIKCESLRNLTVQNNNISDERLTALLEISTLQSVNFSYNGLGDAAAERLAQHPSIMHVNASFNLIGNDGIAALLRSCKLQTLEAEGNKFDASIASLVFENKTMRDINLRNEHIDRQLNQRFKDHVASNYPADMGQRPKKDLFFQAEKKASDSMDEQKRVGPNNLWCSIL